MLSDFMLIRFDCNYMQGLLSTKAGRPFLSWTIQSASSSCTLVKVAQPIHRICPLLPLYFLSVFLFSFVTFVYLGVDNLTCCFISER